MKLLNKILLSNIYNLFKLDKFPIVDGIDPSNLLIFSNLENIIIIR